MSSTRSISRRSAMKAAAAGIAVPFVYRAHAAHAAPSETLLHVSVGAGGMAGSDIGSLTGSKNLKLIAVADVDSDRAAAMKKRFPDIKVYADWREMFDKEKFDSVNVSTPDHMHAAPTMRALRSGKSVYTQKPLTQTIYESRQLTLAAKDAKGVTQMGTQGHPAVPNKIVRALIQSGTIGKVKEVHSWSGKDWGDSSPRPDRTDPVPANLNWDLWLGVAAEVPFLGGGYYHPGNWRKRLAFGTGTFGDMACHILDPVYNALALTLATSAQSNGDAPNQWNWGLDCEVAMTFPATKFTTDSFTLNWYNGKRRPPEAIVKQIAPHALPSQGSIYVGTDGVLFAPYVATPVLLPADKFASTKLPEVTGGNHYLEFIEAARGNGKTSCSFAYAGPLTEMVLLGCLATRFPKTKLEWDAEKMKVTNVPEANQFVRRQYRKGWEEAGL